MTILSIVLIVFVALLHFYFMLLEIYFWDKPLGLRSFGIKPEFAKITKSLAANQGLYNGFIATGLIWGLSASTNGQAIKLYFLACVVVAGIFGALTASRKIFFIQAMPGALAFIVTWLAT